MSDTSLVLSNHGLRHSGGIERYLLTLVDGLHALGLKPTVIAHKFDQTIPEYAWVNPIHIPTWGLGGALRDLWFDSRLQKLKKRQQWFPLIALSQTSAADIAICGGTHPGYLEAVNRTPNWKDKLAIALEAKHLGQASVVIAHSALMARQVTQYYGINPAKVNVLYPPVDTQRFHPVSAQRKQALREQLGLPQDRCVFLLASTGHARKGLDLLVQALGHSDLPVLLVVAGRPVDVEAPNLRYLGYRSDIEDVYRAVDCTVMASRYEPFGLVGVETVLCGTPLLGAEGMGCMEVLQGEAVIPFRIEASSQQASLQRAIEQVLSRWSGKTLHIADPLASLTYDPTVEAHLQAILQHVKRLRASQTEHKA